MPDLTTLEVGAQGYPTYSFFPEEGMSYPIFTRSSSLQSWAVPLFSRTTRGNWLLIQIRLPLSEKNLQPMLDSSGLRCTDNPV